MAKFLFVLQRGFDTQKRASLKIPPGNLTNQRALHISGEGIRRASIMLSGSKRTGRNRAEAIRGRGQRDGIVGILVFHRSFGNLLWHNIQEGQRDILTGDHIGEWILCQLGNREDRGRIAIRDSSESGTAAEAQKS